jgi:polysaccharide biosynthesis/export protein PslD
MLPGEYHVGPLDKIRLQVVRIHTAGSEHKIEAHDRLSISFAFGSGEYRLMPGDELKVAFNDDPTLDFQTIVRTDGRITLPGLAEIQAAEITALALANEINKSYVSKLSDPRSTVTVIRSNLREVDSMNGIYIVRGDGEIAVPILGEFAAAGKTPAGLANALSEAASIHFNNSLVASISSREKPMTIATEKQPDKLHELDKVLTVSSEGNVLLPEIGSVHVAGSTLSELRGLLKRKIQAYASNPVDIAVNVEPSEERAVFVSGEVNKPGVHPYTGGMTLTRAIAASGGVTDEGDVKRVVLIHYPPKGKVQVYKADLRSIMSPTNPLPDLALSPQDVIYVPKTAIAGADLFVEQYINKLIPFTKSINYTYSQIPSQTTF